MLAERVKSQFTVGIVRHPVKLFLVPIVQVHAAFVCTSGRFPKLPLGPGNLRPRWKPHERSLLAEIATTNPEAVVESRKVSHGGLGLADGFGVLFERVQNGQPHAKPATVLYGFEPVQLEKFRAS